MNDDAQLLHRYLEARSQEAFTALVERHLGLVYHAAVRQLGGDAHQAKDVAQAVFVLLAEKAWSLRGHPSLAGWLHTATRFKVVELRRAEMRRRQREEAVHAMSDVLNASAHDEDWAKLRPVIDDVLAELGAADREAVLLRFFEGRSFTEIGGRMRLSEKSAHKRVERALEKVRGGLRRRGIFSTGALAAVLGCHAGMAAPAGLAAGVAGATAAVVSAPLSTAGASFTAIQFMNTTKALVGMAAVVLVCASAVGVREVQAREKHAVALAALRRENDGLAARLDSGKALLARLEKEQRRLETAQARSAAAAQQPRVQSNLLDGQPLLDAHPELRAALVKAMTVRFREELKPFFEELRLTEAQREQIVGIRVRATRRLVGAHQFGLEQPAPIWDQVQTELTAVLGEEGLKRYREYERAMPTRYFAEELTSMLYATKPLARENAEHIQRIVRENVSRGARKWFLTAAGWQELRNYADKLRSPGLAAAIEAKYTEQVFQEAHTQALKAHAEAAKATTLSP